MTYNVEIVPEDFLKLFLLIIILILFYYQLNKNKVLPYLFINHFIGMILMFISLFLIEKGVYLKELDIIGFSNGSFYLYTTFSIIFIVILNKVESISCGSFSPYARPKIFIFIYLFYIIFTYLYTGGVDSSTHSKASIFAQEVGPARMTIEMKLLTFMGNIIHIASRYYFIVSRKKYFYLLLFIEVIYMLFVTSFGSSLDLFVWLLLRFALINNQFKIKPIHLITVLLFVGVRVYIRILSFGEDEILLSQLLIYERFAGQAQLFWVSIHESYSGEVINIISAFWLKFLSLRNAALNIDYGFGHYMFSVNPTVAKIYINEGVGWSSAFPGIYIYYYGLILGSTIFVFSTLIIMKIYQLFMKVLVNKNVFAFILYYFVFGYVAIDYYGMGDTTRLNMRFIFYLLFFVFVYFRTIQDFFLKALRHNYNSNSCSPLPFVKF